MHSFIAVTRKPCLSTSPRSEHWAGDGQRDVGVLIRATFTLYETPQTFPVSLDNIGASNAGDVSRTGKRNEGIGDND